MSAAITDPLAAFASAYPEQPALLTPSGEGLNARQLDRAADRAVGALRTLGAGPGTVVGLEGEPGAAWLAALAGCWRLGSIAAPLNHRMTPADRDTAAATLGCQLRWTPGQELPGDPGRDAGQTTPPASWSPGRPLLRVCTSGSTGQPRSVELLAGQMHAGAEASRSRLGDDPRDRWLVCLPVNHVGALAAIYRCLHNRILLELHPGFEIAAVADRLDSGEISLVSLVPAMLQDILDYRGDGPFPETLRVILLGGAPCTESLLERCRKASLPVSLTWGMTETGSQVATREPGDLSPLEDGLPPLPQVTVRVDPQGRLVVEGAIAGGRLLTADLGEITSAGRVRILGRADGVIIRGGEKILPSEIEEILCRHPRISAAAVVPRPDTRLGQVPVAFFQGQALEARALRDWCRQFLAGFKIPADFIHLATLPRTMAGKIDRMALQARASGH
jgi:O-succinylbenzoic acid--CoA ligase